MTVGTWIVNFVAAVQGGVWERAAGYTPTAMVAEFQHGLIRLDVVLIALALVAAGTALAAIWLRLGVAVRRRVFESVGAAGGGRGGDHRVHVRDRQLGHVRKPRQLVPRGGRSGAASRSAAPLRIEAHLAPEDPRRSDLEHRALSKLRRVMPKLQVQYVSATSIGLFEQTSPHYGEIWYELDGRKAMSRVTTAEGVLEAIYELAGVTPPVESDAAMFRGHPLAVPPKGAATVFYRRLAGAGRRRRAFFDSQETRMKTDGS